MHGCSTRLARRSLNAAPALTALLFSAGCAASNPPPAGMTPSSAGPTAVRVFSDTAQFRGGPSHTGRYAGADFSALGGVAWTACTGGAVRSSAAIADRVVYIGSGDGVLRALDLESGALRWGYEAGAPLASSPAVAGDRVVAVDRVGVIHGVERGSGRVAWVVATGADLPLPWGREGWDYFTSSPTVVDGVAVVAGGDGVLRRLRLEDGALLGETDLGTRLRSSPAVHDGRGFVGGADGVVYAVELATGRVVWRHETEGAALVSADHGYDRRTVQASPAVADGRVYIGGRDGRLYALDAETGERLWAAEYTPSWVVSSVAVGEEAVYTGTSDAHVVEALDAATGERRWSRDLGTRVLGSPSLVGGVLLVPGGDGVLYALDAASGRTLWRYTAGAMIQSSPAVAGDLVVVGDDHGRIHALRTGDATPRLAVFHDTALAELASRPGGDRLADDLEEAGYARLDAAGLAGFLADRIDDGAPSVVVFAQDHAPATVAPGGTGAGLLRRYLEGGGKVVWLGLPPRVLVRDSTGRPTALDAGRAEAVAGVDFTGSIGSDHAARPTAAGRTWGLDRVRLAAMVPPAAPGATVLARDEIGQPAAFVRPFGGREGTGFVFLWGRGYRTDMLGEVRAVAEHGVLRAPGASGAAAGACPAGSG